MHFISIFGIATFVCFTVSKGPDDIDKVNSEVVNRAARIEKSLTEFCRIAGISQQAFTNEEMKEAKKLMKCIRREAAAQHNHPDPDDDSITSDDIVKTVHQLELDASEYPKCRSLVKGYSGRKTRQVPNYATRWDDNTVHWKFDTSNDTTDYYKDVIRDALAGIEAVTCIDFVELASSDPEPSSFIRITDDDAGCWSYIGRKGGNQQLQLQANRGVGHCQWTGTVQHEFIHALGVYHEQVRSDRDDYVIINFDNIKSGYESNFQKCTSCLENQTPYDYESVMHYGKTEFSKNGENTITPIPDSAVSIGQRDGLSQLDADLLNYLYPCPSSTTAAPTTTTAAATTTTAAPTTTTAAPTTTIAAATTTTAAPMTTTAAPTTTIADPTTTTAATTTTSAAPTTTTAAPTTTTAAPTTTTAAPTTTTAAPTTTTAAPTTTTAAPTTTTAAPTTTTAAPTTTTAAPTTTNAAPTTSLPNVEIDCGNCLDTHYGVGCEVETIQQCVCNQNFFCCNRHWGHLCVAAVETVCQFMCKKPETVDCGNCDNRRRHRRGCNVGFIEDCVCEADTTCCSRRWGRRCVAKVFTKCGLTCKKTVDCGNCDKRSRRRRGCNVGYIQYCVCAAEPTCCSHRWRRRCVAKVFTKCGVTCTKNFYGLSAWNKFFRL